MKKILDIYKDYIDGKGRVWTYSIRLNLWTYGSVAYSEEDLLRIYPDIQEYVKPWYKASVFLEHWVKHPTQDQVSTVTRDCKFLVLRAKINNAFSNLGEYVQNLMARNCFQVLGPDLQSPSLFVLCYTSDGAETATTRASGGTGQAIRVAIANQIPVFNIANTTAISRLEDFIYGLKDKV